MSGVYVLFDGPPGPVAGRFVETEDSAGRSVNAGEWLDLDTIGASPPGLWALVIQPVAAYVVNHNEGSYSGILTLGDNAMLFDDLYECDVTVKLFLRRDEAEAWLAEHGDEDDEDEDTDVPEGIDVPAIDFQQIATKFTKPEDLFGPPDLRGGQP